MVQRNPTPRRPSRGTSQRGARSHAAGARPAHGARGASARPSAKNARYGTSARNPRAAHAPKSRKAPARRFDSASTFSATPRPSAASKAPDAKINIPLPEGEKLVLTRRQLFACAIGAGAIAVAGVAAASLSSEKKAENAVNALSVAENSVFSIADCETVEDTPLTLAGEYKLPYGTLLWVNSDAYGACLLPTEEGSPIVQAGVLSLATGAYDIVLEKPASSERGFEIVDVRCNDRGIVWVESNCFTDEWRVFAATLSKGVAGAEKLLDSGDGNWDIPSIAVAGGRAFWQVLPSTSGDFSSSASALKSAAFGESDVRLDWESNGRMSTTPYSTGDAVCISPRSESSSSYTQLTLIDAETGAMKESLTLPASMRPLEAAYVNGRFSFTFDSIYTYGEGLASLGTYAPASNNVAGSWFCFDRNPLCAPAWCAGNLIVKSTRAIAGINLADRTMFSLDCPDDCDDYGDFLASSGDVNSIVSYLGMSSDESDKYTLVRVWSA